jgi:hypothetical protein
MLRFLLFLFLLFWNILSLTGQRFFSSEELKELNRTVKLVDTLQAKLSAQTITFAQEKKLRYFNIKLKSKKRFLDSALEGLGEQIDETKKRRAALANELKTLERDPRKNSKEIREAKGRIEDSEERLVGLGFQQNEYKELESNIARVNKNYLEHFTSQKSTAVKEQLALFAAEEELYRVKEMARQMGSYAGFHIGGDSYFTRICENPDRLKVNDVKKNTLTVYSTYFLPKFEQPERLDKLKAEFYLYKGKEIVIYENFTLRPIKELTRIPDGMRYMLGSFIDKGQVFYGDYSFWPNVIKDRNLEQGEYYYEILVEKELADFCTFRLQ